MVLDDTIAAIATPLGEGGLAVIRVSGTEALTIADKCFKPAGAHPTTLSECRTHTIHYGKIHNNNEDIDEVLVSVMRAPRTFTREDTVEISCHGGILIAKSVLDATLAAGARLAEPGEFTKRAFLKGRIDLTQAEAVIDLIQARTDLAIQAANEQLAGKLSAKIDRLREEMLYALAHIEAQIDFPDEDISPDTREELLARLRHCVEFIDQLLRTAREGRILRRGIQAAIIGRPNAGKSSLLNQLLGHDRAIVHEIPGTTRDTIEETANVRGFPIIFIDTAGIRAAIDSVELEGVQRSHSSISRAELIIHVLDASQKLSFEELKLLKNHSSKTRILVLNKTDLNKNPELPPEINARIIPTCCLTSEGIEELKDEIHRSILGGKVHTGMHEVTINSRHQNALDRTRRATLQALELLDTDQPLELVALELRIATNAIGEIIGKTATDDLLDVIFSNFCIGK